MTDTERIEAEAAEIAEVLKSDHVVVNGVVYYSVNAVIKAFKLKSQHDAGWVNKVLSK